MINALKLYPKAVMWSMILSTCLIMEGYDTNCTSACKCCWILCLALILTTRRHGVSQLCQEIRNSRQEWHLSDPSPMAERDQRSEVRRRDHWPPSRSSHMKTI